MNLRIVPFMVSTARAKVSTSDRMVGTLVSALKSKERISLVSLTSKCRERVSRLAPHQPMPIASSRMTTPMTTWRPTI